MVNEGEYRRGYHDGVEASKTPGADLVRAMFERLETPSYRKGWNHGYHGRSFEPGEQGFFDTADESEDEEQNESDDGQSDENEYRTRSYYRHSISSSTSEYSTSSEPAPLTEAEKTRRLVGQIVFSSAFVGSLIYDWSDDGYSVGSVFSGLYIATLSYISFRVIYRLKFWSLAVVAYSVLLFARMLPNSPWPRVIHDVAVLDITNLSGIALIYGIYRMFKE